MFIQKSYCTYKPEKLALTTKTAVNICADGCVARCSNLNIMLALSSMGLPQKHTALRNGGQKMNYPHA